MIVAYFGSIAAPECSISLTAPNIGSVRPAANVSKILVQKRVRAILAARRNRALLFDADLFFDPVWDMLLGLYVAHLGQFDLSVSDVCSGAAVPATTAMRWIKVMEKRGLLHRRPDPMDKRRVFLSLSEAAAQQMDKLFDDTSSRESLI